MAFGVSRSLSAGYDNGYETPRMWYQFGADATRDIELKRHSSLPPRLPRPMPTSQVTPRFERRFLQNRFHEHSRIVSLNGARSPRQALLYRRRFA